MTKHAKKTNTLVTEVDIKHVKISSDGSWVVGDGDQEGNDFKIHSQCSTMNS